jgi:lysophospholipase L1-like esterase
LLDGNSFTHSSQCAVGGWTTTDALRPPSAIAAELDALAPAILFVLFGTNDSGLLGVGTFTTNLNQIADLAEARGAILVLSTAPPRTDFANADALVRSFNTVIEQTASARSLPLIDLYAAFTPLPGRGIAGDGVHPTVELLGGRPASGDFSSAGLQYGHNLRNLLTLQMLDRLRSIP